MSGLKWAGTAAAAVAVIFLVMPADARDSLGDSWRRLTGDPGQACFDYQKTLLKDPYSARFDSYSESTPDSGKVTVKYHAKNSYGAYGAGEALCVVYSGKVDLENTQRARENVDLAERLERLNAEVKCLKGLNELMRSGLERADAEAKVRKTTGCEEYRWHAN